MSASSNVDAADERVSWALSRPLPKPHALNFFRVLGTLEASMIMLGYSPVDAERKAVEALARCKPDRSRRRR